MGDPVPTSDGEVLVPAVAGDTRERRIKISLIGRAEIPNQLFFFFFGPIPHVFSPQKRGSYHTRGAHQATFLTFMILETNVTTSLNFRMSTSKCFKLFRRALSVTIAHLSRTACKLRR